MKNRHLVEHTSSFENFNIYHEISGKPCYTAYIHKYPPQYLLEGIVSTTELDIDDFILSNKAVYFIVDNQVQEDYPTWVTEEISKKFMETQLSHIRSHLGDFSITDNPDKADKIVMITALIDPRKEITIITEDKFICTNRSLIDESIAQDKLIFIKLSI